jgi:hypothetical protein
MSNQAGAELVFVFRTITTETMSQRSSAKMADSLSVSGWC